MGAEHTPAYGVVDLQNCEDEPIHIPGAIQPHGVLLAVDPGTLEVAIASANCEAMTGVSLAEAVGSPLSAFSGVGAAAEVHRRAAHQPLREPLIVRIPSSGTGTLRGEEDDVDHLA